MTAANRKYYKPLIVFLLLAGVLFIDYRIRETSAKERGYMELLLNRFEKEKHNYETKTQNITADNLEEMQKLYKDQSLNRVAVLKKNSVDYVYLYNVLVPEVFCPALVRVGNVNDGGKWVCDPWRTPRNCVMYSLGLNGESSFEVEFQKISKKACGIRGYDKNLHSPAFIAAYQSLNGKVFHKELGTSKGNTVADMVRANNDTRIEFLKMDIEGAEMNVLRPFLDQYTPCMISLEVHGSARKMLSLLTSIARHDYSLFSFEINAHAGLAATEYSFVHSTCQNRYKMIPLASYLKYV